jgi:hypothetical protein
MEYKTVNSPPAPCIVVQHDACDLAPLAHTGTITCDTDTTQPNWWLQTTAAACCSQTRKLCTSAAAAAAAPAAAYNPTLCCLCWTQPVCSICTLPPPPLQLLQCKTHLLWGLPTTPSAAAAAAAHVIAAAQTSNRRCPVFTVWSQVHAKTPLTYENLPMKKPARSPLGSICWCLLQAYSTPSSCNWLSLPCRTTGWG